MNLVTIDDRITRLKEHSVSIEIVERVDRTCFYTTGSSIPLEHEDENVLWIRGQHVLDSNAVKAARSAVALGEKKYETGVQGAIGPTGPVGPPGVPGVPFGGFWPNPSPAPPPQPVPYPGPLWPSGLPYVGDVPGDLGQTTTRPFDNAVPPWITKKCGA